MNSKANWFSRPFLATTCAMLITGLGCGAPEPQLVVEDIEAERPRPSRFDKDQDGFHAFVDCDDENPAIFPGAVEVCDDLDNDCNGLVDDDAEDADLYYADEDRDGFGDGEPVLWCVAPAGYVAADGDCDDTRSDVNPDASPSCDGEDTNCNGSIEDEFWYCESISEDPSDFDPGDGDPIDDDPSSFDPGDGDPADDPSSFDPGDGDPADDPSGFDL